MITDDERFIEIQGILAFSDVHPTDCIKINDLIIELSKQNKELKEQVEELKHIMYVIRDDNGLNHLWCKDMILDWLGSDVK